MKQLTLTREQIMEPTAWEPTGKSPGNTPQAKLQAAQLLMQMAVNPATGIDVHELATVIIAEGPLANAGNIQISKEQMQQNAAAQQAQQLGGIGGPGAGQVAPDASGGPVNPQLPVQQAGAGVPPPQPHGPMPIPQSSIEGPGPHTVS